MKSGERQGPVKLKARNVVFWTASHDIGWFTLVGEQPDGTFAVIAAPDTARGVELPDAVEATLADGQSAAVRILADKTGHVQCSPICTSWQKHSELVMVIPSEEEADADGDDDEEGGYT